MATLRTMDLNDVPPARRTCELPEDHYGEKPTPASEAFIISLTSRNAGLRGGLYVCAEHAAANAKFVVSRVVRDVES